MGYKKLINILIILVVLCLPHKVAYAQTITNKQKAKLLYDLPLYLKWDNDDKIEVIKIGILKGSKIFVDELKERTRRGYNNIISIDVINFNNIADITETQILYLPKSQNNKFNSVKRKILGFNTALISEGYPDKKNIMINLQIKTKKLVLQINADILNAANIKVVSEVSLLGGINVGKKTSFEKSKKNIARGNKKALLLQSSINKKQIAVLSELDNKILYKQKQINELNSELKKQMAPKNSPLTVFSLLFIILILIFLTFRAYFIKNKVKKLLVEQKKEIAIQAAEFASINEELEKLSIVVSETSTAVMILDTNGDFDWINIGFTKLYGYTLQLLQRESKGNIIKASNHPDIESLFHQCVNEKTPIIYESYVITKDKEKKWAQSTLSPILDDEGEVSMLVLIDSDISKIKEAESEIIRQNYKILNQTSELESKNFELKKLSLVASKTDNSVVIADLNGEIEWVNDGFTRLLGVTFEEFSAEYGTNLFLTSLNPNLIDQIAEAIVFKKSINYTSKTYTKDGRLIWIQTTMTPIFNDKGEVRKFIAIDANVTKIKLAEEEIVRQKEKITDSIHYARKIQTAVLPPDNFLKKLLPDHFIMLRPKDIVSGDFYWAMEKGDNLLIAAADCTGHGVPGGFMSMLGMTFLNEIVGKLSDSELDAGNILTELRSSVKLSLRQTGKEGEAKDGMDIALCILDRKTNIMQFAGANSPLFVVRGNGETQQTFDIKADDMPIGIFYDEKEFFTNNTLQLQKGDNCYIFSDGYADQFGGKRGGKFMLKRLKKILALSSGRTLEEQKNYIEKKFDTWKENYRQIDDVLIIGIRI